MKTGKATRPYTMRARARSVEETGERILDSAKERFSRLTFDEATLNDIAHDAGVTVQTVIRRFGSKEALFSTLAERESARILVDREPPSSEVTMQAAIGILVDHYERDGETVLNLLSQEARFPVIAEVMSTGRDAHERWVRQYCHPVFEGASGRERRRRLEAAVAATDLYVWKLLRLDRGLGRDEVERTMLTLLEGMRETGER